MDKNIDKFLKLVDHSYKSDWSEWVEDILKNWRLYEKSSNINLAILHYIREKNMSKEELAQKIGIEESEMESYLRGKAVITLQVICKIEEVLEVELITVAGTNNI